MAGVSDLRELRTNWEAFGREDPLWAILALPGKRFGRWEMKEFFDTGVAEVRELMRRLEGIGYPKGRERALDFGCGVGRLTQALAGHFTEVVGVDIAESMLRRARALNRFGVRCSYVHNDRRDLAVLGGREFDLIYTAYVLQHMEPSYAGGYVAEFVRLLRSGGVAVFQMPAARRSSPQLPASAFRARVALSPRTPLTLRAGTINYLTVTATNLGDVPWPAHGHRAVHVGNHWRRTKDGELVTQDDGRASFFDDVPPGGSEDVTLEIRTPSKAGDYFLDIDLVQEEVTWFAEHGMAPDRITVRVERRLPSLRPPEASRKVPRMEMYTLPPERVREWVGEAGGRVVMEWPLFSAGADWALKEWDIRCYVATRSDADGA
jgi:SAM-dependent methyltransferase